MGKVKLVLKVATKGHKRGDVIEVADAATADALVAAHQASRVKPAKKEQSEED
jgi:hypothetical protein